MIRYAEFKSTLPLKIRIFIVDNNPQSELQGEPETKDFVSNTLNFALGWSIKTMWNSTHISPEFAGHRHLNAPEELVLRDNELLEEAKLLVHGRTELLYGPE